MRKKYVSYAMYIASLLIFGTNGLLVTHMSLESGQIVLMRTLIGGLLLTTIVFVSGRFDRAGIKADALALGFGGFALGMNWVMLFEAYRLLNVSLATLIYYVGPILVLIISPLLFKENLTKRKLYSVLFVIIGLICISGSIVLGSANAKGLLAAVLSAVFYAMLIIFNKRVSHTNGLQTAAVELIVAFAVVLVYNLLTTGLPQIVKTDIPYIAVIGVVNTGLAYWLYFTSIKKLPVQSVALISYVDPVSALIFSALFLNESMTLVQIMGAILIIGGAMVGEIKERTSRQ